jgi:membrane protein
MPDPRSERDNLLLIAATTVLVLAAQRYFQMPVKAESAPAQVSIPDRQPGEPVGTSWKDILWRTHQRFNDDRLLATAAGVVFFGLLAVFPAVTALVSFYGYSPIPRPSAPICKRCR